MKRLLAVAFPVAAAICGQSGIMAPHLGFVQDGAGALRPLYGLAGNLIAGEPLAGDIVSAAVFRDFVWIKTEDKLRSVDAYGRLACEMPAPPGPALFSSSTVLYPGTMELQPLGTCRAGVIPVDSVTGDILSFASPGRNRAGIIVRRESQLWLIEISSRTGRLLKETPLPAVSEPILLRDDGSLCYADGEELVIQRPDQAGQRIALGSPATRLAELSGGWIHVTTVDSNLAVRLGGGAPELYRLPEVAR